MILFSDIDILVNGSGVLAENATINSDNSLSPIYSIGNVGVCSQAPQRGLRTNFQLSYFPTLNQEPSISTLQTLKTLLDDSIYAGITIAVGGITGYNCYLEGMTIQANPNNLVKSSVSYVSFQPTSGILQLKDNTVSYPLNNTLAHGWKTFVNTSSGLSASPIYQLSYDFNATWQPVYLIGQSNPVQVKLENIVERLKIIQDNTYNLIFTGQNVMGVLVISGLSGNIGTVITMSGGKIVESVVNNAIDDITRTTITVNSYL